MARDFVHTKYPRIRFTTVIYCGDRFYKNYARVNNAFTMSGLIVMAAKLINLTFYWYSIISF